MVISHRTRDSGALTATFVGLVGWRTRSPGGLAAVAVPRSACGISNQTLSRFQFCSVSYVEIYATWFWYRGRR